MAKNATSLSIFPTPTKLTSGGGFYTIPANCRIACDEASKGASELFAAELRALGISVVITSDGEGADMRFTANAAESLGQEGYSLFIDEASVRLSAHRPGGVFYGTQTLRQLLPVEAAGGTPLRLPTLTIEDKPRYEWRGLMLDVSRHFFDGAAIRRVIDHLALHKMNVLHWHLVDDGGWRMEIKRYPNLTEHGAWRAKKDFLWDYCDIEFPGKQPRDQLYGGFYTQEEMREIVRYAAERNVSIVPEIEMPGHSLAGCWSYPETTCDDHASTSFMQETGMRFPNVFCAGKEATFRFLQDVLEEVLEVFPSPVIHIGGDEVSKKLWQKCSDCQGRIRKEGLANEDELQSYFIRRIETFLNSKGRNLMGWDEILEGGLAPRAEVMSWRGIKGGIEAAKAGHSVVMTPTSHCYFDYDYTHITDETILTFDPCKDLSERERTFVKGGQGNVWSEYIPDLATLDRQMFPRLAAMAEVLWRDAPDLGAYHARKAEYLERLDALGVRFHGSEYWSGRPDPQCQTGVLTF